MCPEQRNTRGGNIPLFLEQRNAGVTFISRNRKELPSLFLWLYGAEMPASWFL
jgi:hypothetical protein